MRLPIGQYLQDVHSLSYSLTHSLTGQISSENTNIKEVKDHCHYTGKLRGSAHSKCNLNYKVLKYIPIIIHNASYDTHFIINQLAEEFKGELNCIV